MKKIWLFYIAIIIAIIYFCGSFYLNMKNLEPLNENGIFKKIEIKKLNSRDITETLNSLNLIRNTNAMQSLFESNMNNIKKGTYYISSQMSGNEILHTFEGESYKKVNFTLLTNTTINKFSEQLNYVLHRNDDSIKKLFKSKNFLIKLSKKFSFIKPSEMIKKDIEYYLEGYLISKSYAFDYTWTYEKIIAKLLESTQMVYNKYKNKMDAKNLSFHELVALSSCLSAELGERTNEYKVISGIFWNRLRSSMPLQLDATFIYGYNHGYDTRDVVENRSMAEMQKLDTSHYNTYLYSGIPVGGITSINEKQIIAILNETNSDYMYYFHKDSENGRILVLSKSYKEHLEKLKR